MQQSPYEIKDKLLQALDHEYNVVDMAAVLEIIAALEKACITKEALEKTRIGRYINELRKKTTNEQLARRAKDLVKSWRKLLPQASHRVNGEDGITVGPGPGPGFGPGPGPGNKILKCVSVPSTPRYKTSSPKFLGERSSSPLYFSSASNSPSNSVYEGSNLYAQIKFSEYNVSVSPPHGEKVNCVSKSLSNQSFLTSNQTFKPISPFASFKQAVNNFTCVCPDVNPEHKTNSSSSSTVSVNSKNVSPGAFSPLSVAHSTLDIDKVNVANKRLRKEEKELSNSLCSYTEPLYNEQSHSSSNSNIQKNGIGETIVSPSSEKSSKKFKTMLNSKPNESAVILVTNSKTPKRKGCSDKNELGDISFSLPPGSKVKTTEELIADLEVKKGIVSEKFSSVNSLNCLESQLSQTKKSEMLENIQTEREKEDCLCNRSPTDESSVSNSDYNICGSHSVPDISSVINSTSNSDPLDEEIKRLLSSLPQINPDEIDFSDDEPIIKKVSVSESDLERLCEPWEFVNGTYDCRNVFRRWDECSEQKTVGENTLLLLPYVNID